MTGEPISRLQALRLFNVRSHADAQLGDLVRLNLLYGPNGAGKSSFLRMLAWLAQSVAAAPRPDDLGSLCPVLVLTGSSASLHDAGGAWDVVRDHATHGELGVALTWPAARSRAVRVEVAWQVAQGPNEDRTSDLHQIRARVSLHEATGQELASIADQASEAPAHFAPWDARMERRGWSSDRRRRAFAALAERGVKMWRRSLSRVTFVPAVRSAPQRRVTVCGPVGATGSFRCDGIAAVERLRGWGRAAADELNVYLGELLPARRVVWAPLSLGTLGSDAPPRSDPGSRAHAARPERRAAASRDRRRWVGLGAAASLAGGARPA